MNGFKELTEIICKFLHIAPIGTVAISKDAYVACWKDEDTGEVWAQVCDVDIKSSTSCPRGAPMLLGRYVSEEAEE